MNFSIGYFNLSDKSDNIVKLVDDYPQINEVYFAMPGEASGRFRLEINDDILFYELRELYKRNINLVLLLNASCYGDNALSEQLTGRYLEQFKSLSDNFGVRTVTTTSPFIAKEFRKHLGNKVRLRASVNMRVGNIDALNYLKEYFDGFYIQRELYRDLDYLKLIKRWSVENSKSIHCIANSGCFAHCPYQTFHDNYVSHNVKTDQPAVNWDIPGCWDYLKSTGDLVAVLKACWIRPEDLHFYTGIFSDFKLATRNQMYPRLVVDAYARQSFKGLLCNLLEPGHGPLLNGLQLNNELFPAEWIGKVSNCKRECYQCDYCEQILAKFPKNLKKALT